MNTKNSLNKRHRPGKPIDPDRRANSMVIPNAIFFIVILLTLYFSPQQLCAQKFADSVKWRINFTAFDSTNPSYHAYAMLGFHTQAHYGLPYDTIGPLPHHMRILDLTTRE